MTLGERCPSAGLGRAHHPQRERPRCQGARARSHRQGGRRQRRSAGRLGAARPRQHRGQALHGHQAAAVA
eukprot:12225827-Alexandrium_andersonii.AAC.1